MISGTKLARILVHIDCFCDHIPVVSTVTNLVDIVEKCIIKVFCKTEFIENNQYFAYLKMKDVLTCIALLIPILGNIVIVLVDDDYRKGQSRAAQLLNLDVKNLPRNVTCRQQIINDCRKKKGLGRYEY